MRGRRSSRNAEVGAGLATGRGPRRLRRWEDDAGPAARRSDGLPVTPLDSLLFEPDWTKVALADWMDQHGRVIAGQEWLLDGNIRDSGGIDERLDRAEVAIVLGLPRWLSTCRFAKWAAQAQATTVPR
jgi:adenylate kinase family enzyme